MSAYYGDTLKKNPSLMQIILVHDDPATKTDVCPTAFDAFRRSQPWPALPHDSEERRLLAQVLGVEKMVPCLVLVETKTGAVLTKFGLEALDEDPTLEKFPYRDYKPSQRPFIARFSRQDSSGTFMGFSIEGMLRLLVPLAVIALLFISALLSPRSTHSHQSKAANFDEHHHQQMTTPPPIMPYDEL
eukprot:GHVN01075252.1.p1 GENE.GHVN01075252.1~~GHVN01075252.1.p1  ORF type:complete len:187 (+),score=29.33 GHVN01075252.1:271-831(+)